LHLPQTFRVKPLSLVRLPGVHYYLILLCTGICFFIGFLAFGGLACGILVVLLAFVVLVLAGS
jgi:hypothetical protein